MTLWSESATAIAPIEAIFWSSNTGFHEAPTSVLFHTPPATAPTRPPRNGPIWRHFMPPSKAGSRSGAAALHSHGASTSTTRMATEETIRRVIFFLLHSRTARIVQESVVSATGRMEPRCCRRGLSAGARVRSAQLGMIVRRRQPNCGAFDAPRRAARAGFCDGNVEHFILTSGCRRQQLDEEAGGVFAAGNQLGDSSLLHIIDAGFCRRSLGPPDEGRIPAQLLGRQMHANFGKVLPRADSIVPGRHHDGVEHGRRPRPDRIALRGIGGGIGIGERGSLGKLRQGIKWSGVSETRLH